MSAKKYEDKHIPGYHRDPETGRYIAGAFNLEEFLNFGNPSKKSVSATKTKTGQNSTQKSQKDSEVTKVYKDIPGYIRDPETGKFKAVGFNLQSFLGNNSPRYKSPFEDSTQLPVQPNKIRKTEAGVRKELFTLPSTTAPSRPSYSRPSLRPKDFSRGASRKSLKKSVIPSIVVSKSANNELAQALPLTPMLDLQQSKRESLKVPKTFTSNLSKMGTKSDTDTKILETQEKILQKIETMIEMFQKTTQKFEEFQQIQQQQGEDIRQLFTIVAIQNAEDNHGKRLSTVNKKLKRTSTESLAIEDNDSCDSIDNVKERTPIKQKMSLRPKLYRTKHSASKKPSDNISSIQEESLSPLTPVLPKNEADFKTPDSQQQEVKEFVRLEQLCLTPKNAALTPVSSVCNLFKTMDVEEENGDIDKLQEVCLKRRSSLFKALEDGEEENDNVKVKYTPKQMINTNHVSPVVMKSYDLRKRALTRSLVKKCQLDSPKSPRTRKALDMYISTKRDYNYLLTPSFSKNRQLPNSNSDSLRKKISQKVQQQCLLLQDTP